jgi:SUMO ligase MMS21 Smc5/6 complex component
MLACVRRHEVLCDHVTEKARNPLNGETIEMLQLLKYWWEQEVIAQAMMKTPNPARIA